ncbi:uncharacterized protein N7458_010078 [Penicillium daleae]|uniref:Xylanolytic transcriptional activator regulatory domain-containing protein n=1 Tax=Penicillium daleae TaxID=63821 RepID=A0AAD6BZ32_9EURO|nr:uncharacterized protein N7458_010078 [Penicillium daleae]KAJ5439080.1 hypothetical protein N7458_010078 [Penicillium daleae]
MDGSSGDSQPEEFPNLNTPPSSHKSPTQFPGNTSEDSEPFGGIFDHTPASRGSQPPEKSLVGMFEAFLRQQNAHKSERPGIVVFGEPSPLTFALEELQYAERPKLHSASRQIYDETASLGIAAQPPRHLSETDLAYLKAKGAFDYPDEAISDALISAYFERFHPLCSIVEKSQLERDYREQKLPWIILHAVCFIGATFCDDAVIHRSGFKSRFETRQFYYEKAKVLFTVGYHSDKIVLLQAALMLSFFGPHIHSYWNPGSWTGFGVTIAVSLGLHRAATYTYSHFREVTSLLRRVWWNLVIRDAYTSALLGRSFRLNMSLCDTEPLTFEDFECVITCPHEPQADCHCKHPAHYQIQMSKLSLLLRRILISRFGPGESTATVAQLHQLLSDWQSELPESINWDQQTSPLPKFSVIFKIMFHHHVILLHMSKPERVSSPQSQTPCSRGRSTAIAESAASSIASTAITIMTNSALNGFPHELFPAFFLAGIIFYRQWRQSDSDSAEKTRASLDNCLIVLNHAADFWDPANWAVKLFDFLSSSSHDTGGNSRPVSQEELDVPDKLLPATDEVGSGSFNSPMLDVLQTTYAPFDTSTIFDANIPEGLGDIMLMPNFWLPAAEDLQMFPL